MPTSALVRVPGRVFTAHASSCHDAELRLDDCDQLTLHIPTQNTTPLDAHTLRWRDRVGRTPVRAVLPDGRVFETQAFEAADTLRLRVYHRRARSLLQRLEDLRPQHLLGTFLLMISTAAAGVYWGLPWLADQSVRLVPLTWEAQIGAGVLDAMDATMLSDSTLPKKTRKDVQAIFTDLLTQQPAPHYDFQLHVRRSKALGANALALPGGLVVITDDLIALAQNRDEIAAVLAHELGHVHHRHGMRGLARASGFSFVSLFILGDGTGILNDMAAMGTVFLQLSHSRAFEYEADIHSMALMRATGRNPRALAAMLTRLQTAHNALNKSSDPETRASWLSTHPATRERIRAIEANTQINSR